MRPRPGSEPARGKLSQAPGQRRAAKRRAGPAPVGGRPALLCTTGCETPRRRSRDAELSNAERPIQVMVVFAMAMSSSAQAEGWKLGGKELYPWDIVKRPGSRPPGICGGEGKGSQAGAVLGAGHERPQHCAYRDRRRGTQLVVARLAGPMSATTIISSLRLIPKTSRSGACARGVDSHQKQSSLSAARTPKCRNSSCRPWPRNFPSTLKSSP